MQPARVCTHHHCHLRPHVLRHTTTAISVSMSVLPIQCISRTCSWLLAPWPQYLCMQRVPLTSCKRIHFTWATRIPRGVFALGRPNVTAGCHTSVLATAHRCVPSTTQDWCSTNSHLCHHVIFTCTSNSPHPCGQCKQGDALDPTTYKGVLSGATLVVSTIGTLLESDWYKRLIRYVCVCVRVCACVCVCVCVCARARPACLPTCKPARECACVRAHLCARVNLRVRSC
jgi:hypothetical protein